MPEQRWTAEELADLSRRWLCEPGTSRRVRWNPTPRLIRYYTTLGLLDRPHGVRGHPVSYGTRHLMQLLAVKALQITGLPLHSIQHRLQGLPDTELAALAGVTECEVSPERPDFWTLRPQVDSVEPEELPLHGLELAPGVTLILDRRRYGTVDLPRLRQAAAALLDALNVKEKSDE